MKSLRSLLVAPVAAFVLAASAYAADPSGTWTWTTTGPNGNSFKQSMKLELKDGKLTGSVTGWRNNAAAPISEASFDGNVVKFSVTRELRDRTFTSKYEGKLEGDTITGSIVAPPMRGGGESHTIEWKAERAKS